MNEICVKNFLEKSFLNENNGSINQSTIKKINILFNLNLNINVNNDNFNKPLKLERHGPLDELLNNIIISNKSFNINDIKNTIEYFYTPKIFI